MWACRSLRAVGHPSARGRLALTIEQLNDALAAKAAGSTLAAIHAKAEFLSGETIRGAIAIAAGIE